MLSRQGGGGSGREDGFHLSRRGHAWTLSGLNASPSPTPRRTVAPTWPARLWLGLMGGAFALLGGFFCWYLGHHFLVAKAMEAWPKVPATILAAEIEPGLTQHGTAKFTLNLRYRYQWEGQAHEGRRLKRRPIEGSDRPSVETWLNQYPVGSEKTCYVNPADPNFAVLIPDSKAALYSLWLPAFFLISGLFLIGRAILGK